MLIVEGMDNTGKSTLVTRLADDLKLIHISNKQRPRSRTEYFEYLAPALNLAKRFPTVFDRWAPISDPIYGPICRGSTFFTEADLTIATDAPLLLRLKPMIIYCRPSDRRILNFGDREQMDGVIKHGPRLIQAYDQAMDHWAYQYNVIRYNFEQPGAYDVLRQRVLEHLKENYARHHSPA